VDDLVEKEKGLLAWFARNHVAANILMMLIIGGGVISLLTTKVEIFPDLSVDIITVTVPYLGASPAESEEGVCVKVEEAVAGIEGVKRLRSTAYEGAGSVMIEVEDYADIDEVYTDVEAEVGRIITFPRETEKPVITKITTRNHVISIVLYGDVPERTLKNLAEHMRDDLTATPIISQVDVAGARKYEISIEVSEENLRRYGLSFDDVTRAVGGSSLDLPGGSVKTRGGEILIRTKGQMYRGREFEEIVVKTNTDGTEILLEDIATVVDGFEDSDLVARFDGQPAVTLQVYRVGEQNLLDLTKVCKDYIAEQEARLPEGVSVATWSDASELLRSRIELLVRNARLGLIFVFIILSLFLDLRLAFWTTLGIPISFMGAFWLMPYFDVSVNAIVVGENIFAYRQQGMSPTAAAITGVKEMAAPVTMAVLTTIFAFTPLLYVYGVMGKFIKVIPIVVICILSFSLVEALLILPAHLSGSRPIASRRSKLGPIGRFQKMIRDGLKRFVEGRFAGFVERAVAWRYLTLAVGLTILISAIGWIKGGYIKYTMFPKVDADNVWAALSMPQGTTLEQTQAVVTRLEVAAEEVRQELDAKRQKERQKSVKDKLKGFVSGLFNDEGDESEEKMPSIFGHISATIGDQPFTREGTGGPPKASDYGAHAAEVNIELLSGEVRGREYSSTMIAQMWREKVGEIAGISSLTFNSSLFHGGDAINVEMSHYDFEQLLLVVEEVKQILSEYTGVIDIEDTFEPGKMELKLELKEQGSMLGLTLSDVARQVRQGFYGDEVQRIQRGRDDIRVMVRYPKEERKSLADIENMRIRLPDGTEIPFNNVAEVYMGRGYANINRADRRRIVNVKADVDQQVANANEINSDLKKTVMPELRRKYPGLIFGFEGEQREQREISKSLGSSAVVALLAIFGILAVQFRSYIQPTIIMSAIPFGLVGAIFGHELMNFDLSILSVFGIVALTGIVVNDSLIMIDLINRERREGIEIHQVIRDSVVRRFRPILLTTLTTFCGLVPMMLEKSLQAKFLIPMAVSLAFGVLFATMITLILVPSLYMILEDVKVSVFGFIGRVVKAFFGMLGRLWRSLAGE
jgi:multidrug efflux pump subunit AcrB